MPNVMVNYRALQRAGGKAPTFGLVSENGDVVYFPLGPPLTRAGGMPTYDELPRWRAAPILTATGRDLSRIDLDAVIAGRDRRGNFDYRVSVESTLKALRRMSDRGDTVRLKGYSVSKKYKITSYGEEDILRRETDNALTRSRVQLTLTEVLDVARGVGPLTGGAKKGDDKPDAKKSGGDPGGANTQGTTEYTVKSGDTLWRIADRVYGNGALWPTIADANKLSNPNLIRVGQVLKIPPKQ